MADGWSNNHFHRLWSMMQCSGIWNEQTSRNNHSQTDTSCLSEWWLPKNEKSYRVITFFSNEFIVSIFPSLIDWNCTQPVPILYFFFCRQLSESSFQKIFKVSWIRWIRRRLFASDHEEWIDRVDERGNRKRLLDGFYYKRTQRHCYEYRTNYPPLRLAVFSGHVRPSRLMGKMKRQHSNWPSSSQKYSL